MKLKVATRRRTIDHHPMLLTTKLDPFLTFLLLHHLHLLLQLSGFGTGVAVANVAPHDPFSFVSCPRGTAYYNGRCCKAFNGRCYSTHDIMKCYNDGKLPCDEALALRAVMDALTVPSMPLFDQDFCEKTSASEDSVYISCNCTYKNNTVCHITGITVFSGGLRDGHIHNDVAKLTFLSTLSLGSSNLHHEIPDTLGNLTSLETLNLQNNFLNGSIPPSLGRLSSLTILLSSPFLKVLGSLPNLKTMRLEENNLTGEIPPELGKLVKLQLLSLSSNNLTGNLPKSFKNLKSLNDFSAAGNSLSGSIPRFISNWTQLTNLEIMGNNFEGNLPPEIFKMSNLEYLSVSDLLCELQQANFFFPAKANLTNISTLILRNCCITGHIPEYIGNLKQLSYLDLSFNKLTGGIPQSVKNTTLMILTGNMLNGSIPASIAEGSDLSFNNFSTFPSNHPYSEQEAGKGKYHPTVLDIVDSHYSWIFFETYCCSTSQPNWTYADDVTKEYCPEKSKYQSLFINCGGPQTYYNGTKYDADNTTTRFNGTAGKWAYSCSGNSMPPYLDETDFRRNKTCGVSDDNLHETARICPVSLVYYGFCLYKGNYTVKLHFAEVVYTDDQDSSSSGKRVFDVYIQRERKLQNFNIKDEAKDSNKAIIIDLDAYVDKKSLEIRFFWAGKGSTSNGPLVSAISVTPKFKIRNGLSASQIAAITIAAVLAPILLLLLLWKMGWLGNRELEKVHVDIQGRTFTVKAIIAATKNFSPNNEIGTGRFGIVYKAELSDQIIVAVKKVCPESIQGNVKDELQGELFFNQLKSLKHENLVQLFGGYSRKGLNLLIYEFMEKGSLHQALFDPKSNVELDWKVRFEICLGLAKALRYLHEGEKTGLKIIHRNIKSSNILLDRDFTAKLTDFGLATLYNEEDPFMTIKAGGARVYLAPEYALKQLISDKADVYSFGVVTLELFSGRPSVENITNQEARYLLDDARVAHAKKNIYELFDKKLTIPDRKMALIILNLAMMCIQPTAALRPSMSEVVSVLSSEKNLDDLSKDHTS